MRAGLQVIGGSMMVMTAPYVGLAMGAWFVVKGADEIQAGVLGGGTVVYGTARAVGLSEGWSTAVDIGSTVPDLIIGGVRGSLKAVTGRGSVYLFSAEAAAGKAAAEVAKGVGEAAAEHPEQAAAAGAKAAEEVAASEAVSAAPKAGAMINGVQVPTLTVSKDAAAMAREAGQVFAKTTQGWSAADKAAFWEALARQIETVHSPAWVSVPMKGVNGEFVFSGGSFGVHGLVIFPDGSLGIIGKTVDVTMDLKTALVTVTRRPTP